MEQSDIDIDNSNLISEFIKLNLHIKPKEKKQFGEVFTPEPLINEMLDQIPKDIWSNPDLRWFDPAVGIGNFMLVVYQRLMKGLKIADKNERRTHIIKNMLYMSEINENNIKECYKCGFMNIYTGDTLKMPKDYFGFEKFDVIVGNPPYNKGGIRSYTGKHLGQKNETVWPKFIENSFELLKPNGYLTFINPLSWLRKSHSVHNLLLEKHIIWMKLWDGAQSKKIINASIPLSLYLLQNKLNINKKNTEIISILKGQKLTYTSNEYLNKNYSIPLAYHSIYNKIINFIETNHLKLEFKTKTIKSSGIKTAIPLNYKLKDMLAIDTYTIKEGILIKKAIEIHPDADKRKIIIANKTSFKGAFIDDGKLSLTGSHKFYITGDNLELIIKMLNFKIITVISNNVKYGQSFLDNQAFVYIPDIRKMGLKDIEEEELYKLIGLTIKEKELIKNS